MPRTHRMEARLARSRPRPRKKSEDCLAAYGAVGREWQAVTTADATTATTEDNRIVDWRKVAGWAVVLAVNTAIHPLTWLLWRLTGACRETSLDA